MKYCYGIALFLIFLVLNGCASSKKSSTSQNVVHGHYEVVKQEPYQANDSAVIKGVIYNKKTSSPLGFAFIQIKDISKGVTADTLGRFSFEVPSGTYQIEAIMVGNTTLLTNPIKLNANTKTEIIFYLGSTWIY